MKKHLLLFVILISSTVLFSFNKKGFDPLESSRIISENTFLDVAEVSNVNWREYMSWTENKKGATSNEYLATLPDSTVWQGEKFEPLKQYYLRHAAYDHYPVVGVSHEQAEAYCTWRADRINETMKLQKSHLTFSCRLPSKAEWEKLVLSDMWGATTFKTEHHNLQKVSDDGVVEQNDITSPVKSFTPSLNGFYNLIGNVAEMLTEKGLAKGASWQHTQFDVSIDQDYTYTKPTNWLGFRCVLVRQQ